MTQYVIPISQVSRQTLSVTLGSQSCQITVYANPSWGVFVSVLVGGTPIVYSSLARDRVGIVRYAWTGFSGELMFVDTQGTDDPDYTSFNDRWLLIYDDAVTLA